MANKSNSLIDFKYTVKNQGRRLKGLVMKYVYANPSAKLKVVGITGTNGKTTTATLLYEIALSLGYKVGLISTVNVMISGKEFVIHRNSPTTPDTVTLNKILSKMVEEKCEYVFMEVTSHAMDQYRVSGINFVGGVFSNLTHDHLNYHKTLQRYFKAKKSFFDRLPKNAFALSNADDAHGPMMLANTRAQKATYGFLGTEDFHGEIVKIDFAGIQLKINTTEVFAPLIGKFNAYNLIAVYSTCMLLGFAQDAVIKNLAKVVPPAGRFECYTSPRGVLGVIDYAHSPDSVENVILAAKGIVTQGSKVITLFGCGGDKDAFKRPIMGKLSATLSDISIFTQDNPRSEDTQKIINDMCADISVDDMKKVTMVLDRTEAIHHAVKIAQKGDLILLLGKGPETCQEINGVKYPWNEVQALQQAFKQ